MFIFSGRYREWARKRAAVTEIIPIPSLIELTVWEKSTAIKLVIMKKTTTTGYNGMSVLIEEVQGAKSTTVGGI